jgi:hypothetical protein
MAQQDYVRTLKQTHQTASLVMPLVTAGLAVMSAVIASHERRSASEATRDGTPSQTPRIVSVTTPAPASIAKPVALAREPRVSVIGYLATLLGTLIKVALGTVAVIAIVAIYFHLEKTNRAILLTVLIVSVLYLTERVARARRRG